MIDSFFNTKMNSLKITIEKDPRVLITLLVFCEKNIIRYFVLVVSMIPIVGVVSEFIIPIAYICLFGFYFRKYGASISPIELCVFFFTVLSLIFTCLFYPINAKYISSNFWGTIFPCFKFFLIGLIIIPDRKTMDLLGKVSCVAILLETVFLFAYMIPRGLLQSDDMNRSYQLLPNQLFVLNYAFNSKHKTAWFFSVVGLVYCLSLGTRGPMIILLGFMYLKLLQTSSLKLRHKILYGALAACLVVFFLSTNLYVAVLKVIKSVFISLGFSTRIVDLAIIGNVTSYMSGREELFAIVLEKIAERPLIGYGVYGEWQWLGWNAHNMLLELLVHFGVIVGSSIFLWMLWVTLKSYIHTPNKQSKDLILIWFCYVFIKCLFGGTWLHFGVFFLIIFCLRENKRVNSGFYV